MQNDILLLKLKFRIFLLKWKEAANDVIYKRKGQGHQPLKSLTAAKVNLSCASP